MPEFQINVKTYVGHTECEILHIGIHDCSERFNGNHKCFIIFGYVSNVNFIASMNLYAVKCNASHLHFSMRGAGKYLLLKILQ